MNQKQLCILRLNADKTSEKVFHSYSEVLSALSNYVFLGLMQTKLLNNCGILFRETAVFILVFVYVHSIVVHSIVVHSIVVHSA